MTVEGSRTERTDKPLLNEPQHRHFEVFLTMLEEALIEIQRLSNTAPHRTGDNVVLVHDADLPAGFNESSEPVLRSIRREMSVLAQLLKIETRHQSPARTTKALLTAELVRIDDSYADKLRGYGAVDARAKAAIDPILDKIRSGVTALLFSLDPPLNEKNLQS
ncbi:MAG: hypothetical protein ABR585_09275 [Gemmatimonadaceae bacterium]